MVSDDKYSIVFHDKPESLGPERTALLLLAAERLHDFAQKVGIDFDGASVTIDFPDKLRAAVSIRK